ncbi:hypothetical protein ORI89_00985 [Sphingobacterium sp. UT-1RO-CII-1]|uniref:hypothetical protein n=1 Tax=Sphingobacterium sp. UT-1RO-CII-1 TaxID=2995225 RepID=UPI00227C45A1|nr:hypothetical protein [Sphingobacterium sp. UT-1RO-CII-1]MCY4778208.1 hypothetical protein [Sphingobacterium sp. UT-1RO-CII-1]
MNNLITNNPIALQTLMSETIFTSNFDVETINDAAAPVEIDEFSVRREGGGGMLEGFVYKGDKSTGILFILRYPEHPYFSPAAETAFVKTIGALQLTPDNVAVVNLSNESNPNDFKKIMDFFKPTKITLLGVEPASLKLPAIQHNSYMKGRVATVFNTFSFEEMFVDVDKKKAFWNEFRTFIGS